MKKVERRHVHHEEDHEALAVPGVVVAAAGDHGADIGNDLVSAEQSTVHPPTSLLHQDCQTEWTVSESLGIRDVLDGVASTLLDVDLEAHDSVLSEVLVCLRTGGGLLTRHVLEEFVKGCALDSLPTEHTVSSWQYGCETKERFTGFVWRMTKLVFVELRRLHKVRTERFRIVNSNLDFATNTTSLWMRSHEIDKLLDGVVIWTRANIEHETILGFQVLADSLEEPLVGVDLTIVPVLDTEHEVDATTTEVVSLDTEVPRRDLETMQNIAWNVIDFDTLIHDITHVHHLEFFITIEIHKAFLEEDFLIEETFLTGERLHALRDVVIAISNYNDKEIILREVSILCVRLQAIVIVEAASQGSLQLLDLLVVHRDTYGQFGVFFSQSAPGANLRDHARVLHLAMLVVGPETSGSQLLIKSRLCQDERLVGLILRWLPRCVLFHRFC